MGATASQGFPLHTTPPQRSLLRGDWSPTQSGGSGTTAHREKLLPRQEVLAAVDRALALTLPGKTSLVTHVAVPSSGVEGQGEGVAGSRGRLSGL